MTYSLQNVRLFKSFSEVERADLIRFMREKKFDSGDTVCTHGEYGNTMIVVTQGALSAVVVGKDDQIHEIARLAEGSVFGEMFCIDPAPRPVTLVANEAATVLELGRDDLIAMRQASPRAASALIAAVFQDVLRRLRSVDERIDRELLQDASWDSAHSPSPQVDSDLPGPWAPCFARLRGSA
jgi:CRP-like cAMP-binding protein